MPFLCDTFLCQTTFEIKEQHPQPSVAAQVLKNNDLLRNLSLHGII